MRARNEGQYAAALDGGERKPQKTFESDIAEEDAAGSVDFENFFAGIFDQFAIALLGGIGPSQADAEACGQQEAD